METEAGNRIIAQFIGCYYPENKYPFRQPNTKTGWLIPLYHSSWDWQIPVWSKLVKLMKEKANANFRHSERYWTMLEKYESAIVTNNPAKGFEVIVEQLQCYTKNAPRMNTEVGEARKGESKVRGQ